MNMNMMLALVAATSAFMGQADAQPIVLTCNDSDNLYTRPYDVVVDLRGQTLEIKRTDTVLEANQKHRIEHVEKDAQGYLITATGRFLNAHIRVASTLDDKWVEYTDAFTNRTFTVDYCK